jgi:hypothetical protein
MDCASHYGRINFWQGTHEHSGVIDDDTLVEDCRCFSFISGSNNFYGPTVFNPRPIQFWLADCENFELGMVNFRLKSSLVWRSSNQHAFSHAVTNADFISFAL